MLTWFHNLELINLTGDWDYYASMATSLRVYLFEHGAIPLWNFHFCGGRPELANPQSWGYVWPSLFAYLFPGNLAQFMLWIALTLVGFFSMKSFLFALGSGKYGSWAGALLYVFNGYFASHFNIGHVTFAFFHLVPLLLLQALNLWRESVPEKVLSKGLWLTLSTFLFFTAAIPHGLFYFYPVVPLFVAILFIIESKDRGRKIAKKRLFTLLVYHVLGIGLSSYRLWPILSWQMNFPRQDVRIEGLTIYDIITNSLRYFNDYNNPLIKQFENQVWLIWEYNAFVGPIPWLLLLMTLVLIWKKKLLTTHLNLRPLFFLGVLLFFRQT